VITGEILVAGDAVVAMLLTRESAPKLPSALFPRVLSMQQLLNEVVAAMEYECEPVLRMRYQPSVWSLAMT
jgi:hypothetical protein